MKRHYKCLVLTVFLATVTFTLPVKADMGISNNTQQIQGKLPIIKTKPITMRIKPITYNPNNLSILSNTDTIRLQRLLGDTTMSGLEEYFIIAEKIYHVNALFLVGLVANESGWNTSARATNGSNNLTGHAVYHSSSRGSTFNSKAECIYETARLIKEDYLKIDGEHYNGESIWDINKKYSESWYWSRDINSIIHTLINKNNTK